jgi:hypothetical protein
MIGQDDFVARNSPVKLVLLVLLSLGFVVLGLWIAGQFGPPPKPSREWIGWLCAAFSAFTTVMGIRRMFGHDLHLRINSLGILSPQWSNDTIPWSEIAEVGVWSHRGQQVIVLKLRHPERFPSDTFQGKIAFLNRKLTKGDVSIGLVGTDQRFDDAMAAIARHFPQAR